MTDPNAPNPTPAGDKPLGLEPQQDAPPTGEGGPDFPEKPEKSAEPKLYAGKFKDAVELEKAYQELQSKFTKDRQAAKTDLGLDGDPPPSTINDVLAKTGLDASAIAEEWTANDGSLSDETYLKFQRQGYPRDVVDTIIRTRQQEAESTSEGIRSAVTGAFGGDDGYEVVRTWAISNLSDADKQWYTSQVDMSAGASPQTAQRAAEWLSARYSAAVSGGTAKPATGRPAASGGSLSKEARAAAFKDPRFSPTLADGRPNPQHDPDFYNRIIKSLGT